MLSWIVGIVDVNAAWVLVVMFVMLGVVGTALVVKRQSVTYMSNQFEVAKLQEADRQQLALASVAKDEKIQLAQIASKQVIELGRINGAQIEGARLVGSSREDEG